MQIYMFGLCLLFVIAVKSLRKGLKKKRKIMEFSIATFASSIATHCFDQVTRLVHPAGGQTPNPCYFTASNCQNPTQP